MVDHQLKVTLPSKKLGDRTQEELIEEVLDLVAKGDAESLGNLPELGAQIMKEGGDDTIRYLLELLGDAMIAAKEPPARALDLVDEIYRRDPKSTKVEIGQVLDEGLELPLFMDLGVKEVPKIFVWRGDMTKLGVDVIVNAANDDGLGCFTPGHKCVDNVIHRAAGPRLRAECITKMRARPGGFGSLKTGTPPILTQAYRLPCRLVAHVTGPYIPPGSDPSPKDKANLRWSYQACLDAASKAGAKSIAFPCLSTGVFNYPAAKARDVALEAVRDWFCQEDDEEKKLDPTKAASIDIVVFDVFADADARAYRKVYEAMGKAVALQLQLPIAQRWLADTSGVLIFDGGQSNSSRDFFATQYPWLRDYGGVRTTAECLASLDGLTQVPENIKKAFWIQYANDVRYSSTTPKRLGTLKTKLLDDDDMVQDRVFIYTTNPDGAYIRAGFKNVYTPEGDFGNQQCGTPCARDAYWTARPELDGVLPYVPEIPDDKITRCPRCGAKFQPNVNIADWFTHAPYDAQQEELIRWLDIHRDVVILDIGGGSLPRMNHHKRIIEAIVREKFHAKLIRVDPTDFATPDDLLKAQKAAELPIDDLATLFPDHIDLPDVDIDSTAAAALDAIRQPVPSGPDDGIVSDWRDALMRLRS